ncbi:MAG: hypothetical protein ABIG64_10590, partial [Candidatus Omnitrophota bacterium]
MKKKKQYIPVSFCIAVLIIFSFCSMQNIYAGEYEDYYQKGQILFDQGKYTEAQIEFEKARKILQKAEVFSVLSETDAGQRFFSPGVSAQPDKLTIENKKLQEQLNALDKETKNLEKENEQLEIKLEKSLKKLKTKEAPIADFKKKIQQLELVVLKKEEAMNNSQTETEQIKKEKEGLENELAVLKKELIDLYQRKEVEIKPQEKGYLEKKFSNIGKMLGTKEESIEKKEVLTLKEKLEHYEILLAEKESLQKKLADTSSELELKTNVIKELGEKINAKENLISKNENEKSKFLEDKILLEKINNALKKQNEELINKTVSVNKLEKEIEQKNKLIGQEKDKSLNIQAQLELLIKEKDDLLKENKAQQSKGVSTQELQKKIDELERDKLAKETLQKQFQADLNNLSKEKESLTKEIDKLREGLSNAEQTKIEVQNQ